MCGGLVSHIHNYLLLLLLRHHQSSSFSVRRRAGSMRGWKRSEEKPIKLFIAFRFVWFFSITIRTFQLFFFIIQFCPVMLSLFFIGFFLSKWTYQCKLTPGFFSLMTFTLLAIFIDSYRKDFKWKKKSFDLMKKNLAYWPVVNDGTSTQKSLSIWRCWEYKSPFPSISSDLFDLR